MKKYIKPEISKLDRKAWLKGLNTAENLMKDFEHILLHMDDNKVYQISDNYFEFFSYFGTDKKLNQIPFGSPKSEEVAKKLHYTNSTLQKGYYKTANDPDVKWSEPWLRNECDAIVEELERNVIPNLLRDYGVDHNAFKLYYNYKPRHYKGSLTWEAYPYYCI